MSAQFFKHDRGYSQVSFSLFFSVFLNEWTQKTQTSVTHFLIYRFLSISFISLSFSLSLCLLCVISLSTLSFVREKCRHVDCLVAPSNEFLLASSNSVHLPAQVNNICRVWQYLITEHFTSKPLLGRYLTCRLDPIL